MQPVRTWAEMAREAEREKQRAEQQELFWGITLLMAVLALGWFIGLAFLQVLSWL